MKRYLPNKYCQIAPAGYCKHHESFACALDAADEKRMSNKKFLKWARERLEFSAAQYRLVGLLRKMEQEK